MTFSIPVDLFPLSAAVLASIACALLGNFLVLRRMSLMGDAISHSVLPGLVIAFMIASSRSPLVMFLGAAIAGALTVVLVEVVKRLGRVEPGAAMGVVFSVLFALGVLLIEQSRSSGVDLDASCVLHGQLETLVWWSADAPNSLAGLWSSDTLRAVPRQVWTLLVMAALSLVFVVGFFKEMRIASFDPALATTQGFSAGGMHYALMLFVAGATVAAFEAVGSILVIAMLICPGATARLLTDRLSTQIVWSVAIAIASALLGYFGATMIPGWFDRAPVNAAGTMGVTSGVLLVATIFASPSHGVIARMLRRTAMARTVALEDLLASLYRAREAGEQGVPIDSVPTRVCKRARARGFVERANGSITLTPTGEAEAATLVRRHRLWEHYLVDRAGFAPDHVHAPAEILEHTGLGPETGPETDPHGRIIP